MLAPVKRLLWIVAALGLAAGAVWLLGRPPSAYWLEQETARFHEERLRLETKLQREVHRAEAAGEGVAESRARYRQRIYAVGERSVRGWSVLLIPDGATRPQPEDYLVFGRIEPAGEHTPPTLRGPVEIWFAPRGALARLLAGLGFSP